MCSPTLNIEALKARAVTRNVIELTTKYYTASICIHLLELESHASGTVIGRRICMPQEE